MHLTQRLAMTSAAKWPRLCILLLAVIAAGCGGGGGKSSSNAPASSSSSNTAPTIQGQPTSSALAGQSYSFQPTATDSNGDSLTFTATNLPSWATLNTSTGRISGTPTTTDVATYGGIVIRVSDGTVTTSLGPFTITVASTANGFATLSWMPPTTNSDGTTLTNLAGYEVHYGRSASNLDQAVSLTNPSINTYLVENLSPGTWYFAIVAINAIGIGSPLSSVASKTIS